MVIDVFVVWLRVVGRVGCVAVCGCRTDALRSRRGRRSGRAQWSGARARARRAARPLEAPPAGLRLREHRAPPDCGAAVLGSQSRPMVTRVSSAFARIPAGIAWAACILALGQMTHDTSPAGSVTPDSVRSAAACSAHGCGCDHQRMASDCCCVGESGAAPAIPRRQIVRAHGAAPIASPAGELGPVLSPLRCSGRFHPREAPAPASVAGGAVLACTPAEPPPDAGVRVVRAPLDALRGIAPEPPTPPPR